MPVVTKYRPRYRCYSTKCELTPQLSLARVHDTLVVVVFFKRLLVLKLYGIRKNNNCPITTPLFARPALISLICEIWQG